ncbi:hypothetical protein TeGR_g4171 [Tetraparma gracilis]|uniref:YhhN-like protein n=1 Tax=Tetraparma gracilis TaxID=2962635 RepID=A0ABQ6MRB7_9STRA|nr:hypothetical protein TeGR_g4171 [Tetraparma gracilis]
MHASSSSLHASSTGLVSIFRRSEDIDLERVSSLSSCLYALALAQMLLYALVLSVPDPPSNHDPALTAPLKALPCATLCINAALRYRLHRRNRFSLCLASAFVFHALGDALLEFPPLFAAGLASFLIAHLLNLAAFASPADADFGDSDSIVAAAGDLLPRRPGPPLRLDLALPFALYAAALLALLFAAGTLASDAALGACVAVYALALAACPWRALVRAREPLPGDCATLWKIAAAGYCVYALSDSLLAIDRV